MGAFSREVRSFGGWGRDLTWWSVRIVFGESHFCFKITTIVEGVGVDDNESNIPVKDIICT